MTIIEQIKAEIERRKMESIGFRNNEKREDWASFFNGEATALENLLSFISTLESEKPVPADLEEAASRFSKNASNEHNRQYLRVGFIFGAKWDREQMMALEECGECKRCIKEFYEELKKS